MFTYRSRSYAIMTTAISLLMTFVLMAAPSSAYSQVSESSLKLDVPVWTEYRDARFGYGLEVPSDWIIYPTPPEGERATLVLTNFGDEGRGITSEQWPKGGLKIDITVFENMDKNLSFSTTIYKSIENELAQIVSVKDEVVNGHSGIATYTVNREKSALSPHKRVNIQFPSSNFMSISVLPEEGWDDPDIKSILDSLSFPDEDIVVPSLPPTSANVILPAKIIVEASPALDDINTPLYVAGDSFIELYMPFVSPESWTVGGAGNFYGEGDHTDAANDFYATDWNDGIDDCGRYILPVAEGTVIASGPDDGTGRGYGNWIKIDHGQGVTTLYGHMSSAARVEVGHPVEIGTILGFVGNTGGSSGCHLHLSFKVNGVSKENISPSRKPSPMWTTTGLWDLSDGARRTVSHSGTIYQEMVRGGQSWRRTIPVEYLVPQWNSASNWAQSSWLGTLPGSGTVQDINMYAIKNTIWQSVWRGDQGWTRTLSIVNGVPNWSGASAWSGPQSLSGLPGSGTVQALNAYAISETLYQGLWRGDQGWSRTVPIVNGQPNWSGASAWSGPQSLSGLPGTGSMQTLNAYPIGNTKLIQSIWRDDQGWTRTVNIVNGQPDWNNAPAFSGPSSISSLPGSGSMEGLMAVPIP